MNKSKLFLFLCLSFIGGIAVASFYYPKIIGNFYLFIILISAIIILIVNYKNKPFVIFSFAILFFISGIYLTNLKLEKINNLVENGKNISGNFIVSKEPEISGKMQRVIVKNGDYKILITAPAYPEYSYGNEIKLSCALKIPRSFIPQGGTQDDVFDWRMYLAKDNILYECDKPKIELINSNKGNKIYRFILKIKNKLNENISKMIPAPESGLMIGLILGGDDKLSKDVQNIFSATGMTHIVAVSGYNVTIVAEYLMLLGIFLGLWRRQAFWFAVAGIILFIAMTGFPSSAVRAGVMGILLIWAMKNGRLANSQNAIIFAAAVMLLINPFLLRWDIGFQLSFLATLGIIYVYPIFEGYFARIVETRHCLVSTGGFIHTLLEILFLTLSAQIFVLPVILFNFQKLSLISPLANLLILPIIPITMLLGFVAVIASFVFYPLGQIFSWLAYLPLKYETTVINYLASLKYSSIEVHMAWWGVVLWYIILGEGIILMRRKIKKERC
jgi:competence protein ComEC